MYCRNAEFVHSAGKSMPDSWYRQWYFAIPRNRRNTYTTTVRAFVRGRPTSHVLTLVYSAAVVTVSSTEIRPRPLSRRVRLATTSAGTGGEGSSSVAAAAAGPPGGCGPSWHQSLRARTCARPGDTATAAATIIQAANDRTCRPARHMVLDGGGGGGGHRAARSSRTKIPTPPHTPAPL